jgi:hypothetical protein
MRAWGEGASLWAANYKFKRSTAATNRSALEQHLMPILW